MRNERDAARRARQARKRRAVIEERVRARLVVQAGRN